jgi:hypothetical protein
MDVPFKIHYRNNLIDKKDSYLLPRPPSWDDRNYSYCHQLYPSVGFQCSSIERLWRRTSEREPWVVLSLDNATFPAVKDLFCWFRKSRYTVAYKRLNCPFLTLLRFPVSVYRLYPRLDTVELVIVLNKHELFVVSQKLINFQNKEVIRIRKSSKDRSHNGHQKRTTGQTTIHKTLHIKLRIK